MILQFALFNVMIEVLDFSLFSVPYLLVLTVLYHFSVSLYKSWKGNILHCPVDEVCKILVYRV